MGTMTQLRPVTQVRAVTQLRLAAQASAATQPGAVRQTGSRTAAGTVSRTPSESGRARPPARHLQLTRRGRGVVVLALLALLLTGLSLQQAHSDAATTQSAPVAGVAGVAGVAAVAAVAAQTIVHRGDTLWSVARRIAPDRDAREVVAELRQLNALRGATLVVGQQLLLPR